MITSTAPHPTRRAKPLRSTLAGLNVYTALLVGMSLLYTVVFAGLALTQHAGMRTHKADLGQIAQAVWNSSRGRFVEMTDNGFIATRMTDHVEPILALISPVLWIWDDVRALLVLQVVAVALGAWPLYALALRLLDRTLPLRAQGQVWVWEPHRRLVRPLALALVAAYLLDPHLQSAVLTEFHAVPLAVPLILWAFWAVEARRWGQFALAVVLVAATKEEMALLAAGLGVWAIWRGALMPRTPLRNLNETPAQLPDAVPSGRIPALVGGALALAALAWFYLTTFVIVPAHAVEVYGVAESGYFQRYGALGDSPLDIVRSLVLRPGLVWGIATEPARLAYLRGLLFLFGFLALLAPEVVLLSLPVLLANLLSAYPAQYYGEFHYSAPLVVYFAAASAFGLARLWGWLARRLNRTSGSFQYLPAASPATMAAVALVRNSRTALRPLLALVLVVWVLSNALIAYAAAGRGPGGGRYDPTPVTAHHRLLPRFLAQIPGDAAVMATAAVHPHVSHRRYVYQFPTGLEIPDGRSGVAAEWALLDVTTATDMAPGDVRTRVEAMLADEWGLVDGADGFLLLRKGASKKAIPEAFYDFARGQATGPLPTAPLTFAGVEVLDWPRWRQTWLTAEWQVGPAFEPAQMAPEVAVRSPAGETLYRFGDATPPALVWYPPERWQPGDRVRITTLPLYLPRSWGLVVEHTPGLAQPVTRAVAANPQATLAAVFRRGPDGSLVRLDDALGGPDWAVRLAAAEGAAVQPVTGAFDLGNGDHLGLTLWLPHDRVWSGASLDLWLGWQGEAWPEGVDAFVHLRRNGENQDQQDGTPRLVIGYTTPPSQGTTPGILDWRQFQVPEEGTTGAWTVAVGLYDPASGRRLPLVDGGGEEVVLGPLELGAAPVPDQACALVPASCAGQP